MSEARDRIALSLGPQIDPDELVFTSSGTEANQLAARTYLESGKSHWVLSATEHDSVHRLVDWFKERGGNVTILPVDRSGRVSAESVALAIGKETALVSVIWVHNETGVINDVASIARVCAERGVPLHLDGAQAWGKFPLDIRASGADVVAFSGHKIGALSGIGVLWARRGTRLRPLILGAQEKGRRGGTENVLGIASLGAAAATLGGEEAQSGLRELRDRMEREILARIPGTTIHGAQAARVAQTSLLTFGGIRKRGLVEALDLAGFQVSAGSACSSGLAAPSPSLLAMGVSEEEALSSVRVSLPQGIEWEALEAFVTALERCVERIRGAGAPALRAAERVSSASP